VAGILALSSWQAGLSRQSPGAHWSVALLALTTIGAAIVLGRGRQRTTSGQWTAQNTLSVTTWRSRARADVVSTIVWTLLTVGVVGWDLLSFLFQARNLPTLSYFIGHVTRYPVGRGILFALWLGIGVYLASARRVERRQ
jgi:hypothetical protein